MRNSTIRRSPLLAGVCGLVLAGASMAFGQNGTMDQGTTQANQGSIPTAQATNTSLPTRSVPSGEKVKIRGTILEREADTFTVQDDAGQVTTVLLTDQTNVKSNGGFLRKGQNYDVTNLLRGLAVEVEGRGNSSGQLAASKIRFDKNDMKVARSIDTRVTPVEGRVSQVEAENRSLSGQVDELNEVSKTMRTDIDQASASADRANAGVATTNERISSLDDYDVQDQAAVYFKVNSSILTPEGKTALDDLATKAMANKGYVIEVTGYTDSTGSVAKNRMLSQHRADSVVQYLAENHDIPLRRIITPFGYGELKPAADNTTRDGRKENRRVEVKILVNKGLTQQSPAAT